MINTEVLAGFHGSATATKWSALFHKHRLTEGALYIAQNGGGHGAFWLMDAIASYHLQAKVRRLSRQYWKLEVKKDGAVLTCRSDPDGRAIVRQKIEYTDFDLKEIDLVCAPTADEDGNTYWIIFLPQED
jgi:hypothetical protein